LHLESEIRKFSTLEQHFVHGKWRIVKVFVGGELHEIIVRHREGS
jgi:hypothetical protein